MLMFPNSVVVIGKLIEGLYVLQNKPCPDFWLHSRGKCSIGLPLFEIRFPLERLSRVSSYLEGRSSFRCWVSDF